MLKVLSIMLSVGLLVSLLALGCGGTGNPQSAEEGNGPSLEKNAFIPPPGTVRVPRSLEWASLFATPSRAMDTTLTLGKYSDTGGAPVTGTVNEERINLYSHPSTTDPIVWTMTPVVNASNVGDNDLGIYANGYEVFASSAHVDTWEEWVATDPISGVGRYFGLIRGAADGIDVHKFQVQADRSTLLTTNGASVTGTENSPGSDWFHIEPVDIDEDGWADPITVTLTAVNGDPDLYLYDSYYGNGSAPVAVSANVGGDSVSYNQERYWWDWTRLYARVRAADGTPCDYTIAVTSP